MSGGHWIKLHRKIKDWEWWGDVNTAHLFIHCLLKANFEDAKWRGIIVKRGSFITSLDRIAKDSGLTIQQARTSLKKLQRTGEILLKSTNKYTVINICNYNDYQHNDNRYQQTNNKQITNEQQTNNKQITTSKNLRNKELKEIKNISTTTSALNFYMDNFGMPAPITAQEIDLWIQDTSDELVTHAMKIAIDRNSRSWGYVKGILKNWMARGVKNVQEAIASDTEFANKQNKRTSFSNKKTEVKPKWLDEPIQEQEETEDIKKRREKMEEWIKTQTK